MPKVTVTVQRHTGKTWKEKFIYDYIQSPYLLRTLAAGTCPPHLHGLAPV